MSMLALSSARLRRALSRGATLGLLVLLLLSSAALGIGEVGAHAPPLPVTTSASSPGATSGSAYPGSASVAPSAAAPGFARATAPLSGLNWTNLTAVVAGPPSARSGAAATYDPQTGYVVLFGGCCAGWNDASDTWAYAAGKWTNLSAPGRLAPPGSAWANMAWDASDGYAVLEGGGTNQTWTFSGGVWSWVNPHGGTVPSARSDGSMAYDVADHEIVYFGGNYGPFGIEGDTWTFSGGVWKNVTSTVGIAPSPRYGASMAYDAADNEVVLYGGCLHTLCNYPSTDTWTFTAGHWTNITASLTTAPGPHAFSLMTYDSTNSSIVLLGGHDGNETWSFHAGAWSNATSKLNWAPSRPAGASFTDDPTDLSALLFGGGTSHGRDNYTWELGLPGAGGPVRGAVFATPPQTDLGQSTVISATVIGGTGPGTYTYLWSGLPSGCSGGNFSTFTCKPLALGPSSIMVAVTDTRAATANLGPLAFIVESAITINSFAANPSALPVGAGTVLTVSVSQGIAPYHASYTGLPPGCNSYDTLSLLCYPLADGTFDVGVTVADQSGNQATQSLTLIVAQGTGGPSIASVALSPSAVNLGFSESQPISALAQFADGSITNSPFIFYNWSVTPGAGVTLSSDYGSSTLLVSGPSVGNGAVFVNVTSAGTTTQVFATVRVSASGGVIPSIAYAGAVPSTFAFGLSTILETVLAPGASSVATLSYRGLPQGCASANETEILCLPLQVGVLNLSVAASDRFGSTSATIVLTVVTSGGTITAKSLVALPSSVPVGGVLRFTASGIWPVGLSSFSYSNVPTGCASVNQSSWSCTPTQAGTFAVNMSVSAPGGLQGWAKATVTVYAVSTSPTGNNNNGSGGNGGGSDSTIGSALSNLFSPGSTSGLWLVGGLALGLVAALLFLLLLPRWRGGPGLGTISSRKGGRARSVKAKKEERESSPASETKDDEGADDRKDGAGEAAEERHAPGGPG